MHLRTISGVVGLTLACALAMRLHAQAPAAPLAATGLASAVGRAEMAPFAGTWRLVATRQRMSDGTIRPDPDLGPMPVGYMMFDASAGIMCVVITNGDRARWRDASAPTDTEAHDLWSKMVTYCATWSVDVPRRELVYTLQIDHSPNRTGTERRRAFTLSGDQLVLRPNPLPAGVVSWEVQWQRVLSR